MWTLDSNLVISTNQEVLSCGQATSVGTLVVEIHRPTNELSVTGYFDPILPSSPALRINLNECPDSMPRYIMDAGKGTRHGFHVQLKSNEYGVSLPCGTYRFSYTARAVADSAAGVVQSDEGDL